MKRRKSVRSAKKMHYTFRRTYGDFRWSDEAVALGCRVGKEARLKEKTKNSLKWCACNNESPPKDFCSIKLAGSVVKKRMFPKRSLY
jgi:hypothetical protein